MSTSGPFQGYIAYIIWFWKIQHRLLMLAYERVIKLPYYIRHKTLVNWTSAVVKDSNLTMRNTGCPQSTFFMISVELNSYKSYSQSFYDIIGVTAIVYISPLSHLNVFVGNNNKYNKFKEVALLS